MYINKSLFVFSKHCSFKLCIESINQHEQTNIEQQTKLKMDKLELQMRFIYVN